MVGVICGVVDAAAPSTEVEAARPALSDAFSELLNAIVGETVLVLHGLGRLIYSPPRVSYGKMSYGALQIRSGTLSTPVGRIECCFHCDKMSMS